MTAFRLRGRQPEWIATIKEDLKTRSRLLCIAPGGVGKTTVFAFLASYMWREHGIRTLVLENRDRLTEQTADRIRKETGLDVDVEKADQYASPYTPIVVGCVQSLSKVNRLTSFSDSHFVLVVVDECHLCLSPSWLRIIHYFHYGAASLRDGWAKPNDGTYKPLANIIGFTASPDLGSRKNLGDLFQGPKPCINYSFLDAIEEGWLVGIKEINVPVEIDTRRFRVKHSVEGDEFNSTDQASAFTPEVIEKLAKQIVLYGSDKKGICFMPSVDIARQMAATLTTMGITAIFVSGECIDKNEKTDVFAKSGNGTWLINCTIYTYGVDFPDVSAIAPFGAIISKAKYVQIVYRGTRVLDGTVNDSMTAEQRVAAIAASAKKELTLISPFYISERIHICEIYDMFGGIPPGSRGKRMTDFTKPAVIRDAIKALEKAADKHANRQPRTIDPVKFSLSVSPEALAGYKPESDADAKPASREILDALLAVGMDTSGIKNQGEANRTMDILRERERLGLASPRQLQQLMFRFNWPEEQAVTFKKGRAGITIARQIKYKAYNKPALAYKSAPIEDWS